MTEDVSAAIADAMRKHEPLRLGALRMLKAALMNRGVEKGRDLDDNEARQVVASLVKQRRESIEQFTKGGRQDLADKEAAEIRVLESYLSQTGYTVHRAMSGPEALKLIDDGLRPDLVLLDVMMPRMSGFSVWTFTGGAGFAYRHGVIGVFLMLLAVPAFFVGYAVFATRWRRARVTTIVEYVRTRFGEGTHQVFSWIAVPSQVLFASVRLFALASFVSVALEVSVPHLIIVCGLVILLYTALGGYWAVCFTDMFQFMFLFPIAVALAVLSCGAAGGWTGFVERAPAGFLNPLGGEYVRHRDA